MKKYLLFIALSVAGASTALSQSAFDAYRLSRQDLRGTARFMSMGGAFGALGGDLSTLSQNPAGIGVYRSHEIGFTLDLDMQHASSGQDAINQTKFLLNNIGGVATWKLGSSVFPNLNLGFTYNKAVSFNRRYKGSVRNLANSMTNYIAAMTNSEEATVADLTTVKGSYDPYNPNDNGYIPQWLSVLAYDSYLISPTGDPDRPTWAGQWTGSTRGSGSFNVEERGHVDEYNISLGGNISNVVYWGMDFGIIDIDYSMKSIWGENLAGASVGNDDGAIVPNTTSKWNLHNLYKASGNGFNYKLGIIVKPIQELRFGFAFHTPTWYNISESYIARVNYNYGNGVKPYFAETNGGVPGSSEYDLRTPWRLIASVAGVVGSKFILSLDYEWAAYNTMHFSDSDGDYYYSDYDPYDPYDPYYPYYSKKSLPMKKSDSLDDSYTLTNRDIKDYYRSQHTLRIGAEYRVTPQVSLRAGYSFVSSPVKATVRHNDISVFTAGTDPSYTLDNVTNYVTCGIGYRIKKFYIDLAYVYKHQSVDYHAFTPMSGQYGVSPQAKVGLNSHQLLLSAGVRF